METKVKPTVETWLCRGYLFLMLALLPLAVHNGFFDITETKTICFTVPPRAAILPDRSSASAGGIRASA